MSRSKRQQIGRAFALGLPGITALVFLFPPPAGVPSLALALNPLILLALAAIAGVLAAPRLGLRSTLISGDELASMSLMASLTLGACLGGAVATLDCATASLWQGHVPRQPALCQTSDPRGLALGLLYGGVTE